MTMICLLYKCIQMMSPSAYPMHAPCSLARSPLFVFTVWRLWIGVFCVVPMCLFDRPA